MAHIPERFRDGIRNWVDHAIQPGSFLCAVLQNDLQSAVRRADENVTLAEVRDLQRFLTFNCPDECFGSLDAFQDWRETLEKRNNVQGLLWDWDAGCWADADKVS